MSKRLPENPEECKVFAILQRHGYNHASISFSTWKSNSDIKPVSVEIKRHEEISAEARAEIKKIYPNSFNHWDTDKEFRSNYLILKP